jgi:hypothetical protein
MAGLNETKTPGFSPEIPVASPEYADPSNQSFSQSENSFNKFWRLKK